MKVADDAQLRAQVARDQPSRSPRPRSRSPSASQRGGKLILFGNGGSATDANDWAIDCVLPPAGYRAVPAVSLSLEPATITAIANDVGTEVIFLRQLIAHAPAGRRRHRDLDQRRLAQHHRGARRGAQARPADGRAARLRRRRDRAPRPGRLPASSCARDYIPRIQEVQASIYHVMREALEMLTRG